MRLGRARAGVKKLKSLQSAARRTVRLTEKGIYSPPIRALVHRLVLLSCPFKNVGKVLKIVLQYSASILGVKTSEIRDLSARTAGRIAREGNVAADVQLGSELRQTPGKLN